MSEDNQPMSEEEAKVFWSRQDNYFLPDEKHISSAMFLLQKAIVCLQLPGGGWPTIHACLREAAFHCEEARKYWTKEEVDKNRKLMKELFGEQPSD